jgi:hypothetical protein
MCLCCLLIIHVVIASSSVCECVDSKIPSQAPKPGTAKPNSDCEKSVKVSINSLNYSRSGKYNQRKKYNQ